MKCWAVIHLGVYVNIMCLRYKWKKTSANSLRYVGGRINRLRVIWSCLHVPIWHSAETVTCANGHGFVMVQQKSHCTHIHKTCWLKTMVLSAHVMISNAKLTMIVDSCWWVAVKDLPNLASWSCTIPSTRVWNIATPVFHYSEEAIEKDVHASWYVIPAKIQMALIHLL